MRWVAMGFHSGGLGCGVGGGAVWGRGGVVSMGLRLEAQILSRDALNHDHGTGAEGTRRLAGSSGGPIEAWLHAEQRAAALGRSGTAAVGEEGERAGGGP